MQGSSPAGELPSRVHGWHYQSDPAGGRLLLSESSTGWDQAASQQVGHVMTWWTEPPYG